MEKLEAGEGVRKKWEEGVKERMEEGEGEAGGRVGEGREVRVRGGRNWRRQIKRGWRSLIASAHLTRVKRQQTTLPDSPLPPPFPSHLFVDKIILSNPGNNVDLPYQCVAGT